MRRTRGLILLLIVVIVAGVATTWKAQKRLQARQAPPTPPSLPESVSARAENWQWEEVRNGKPVVRASAKRQNVTAGKMELEGVELQLFHPDGTYDRVKSAKADFHMDESVLFSEGEVEITMAIPADPNAKPSGRLVTIKTSGARFEAATGKASTDRPAKFQFQRGEGSCIGAMYDPSKRELQMFKDVRMTWRGDDPNAKPMEVEAGMLVYKELESKIELAPWSKFRRDTLAMEGGAAVVGLNEGEIESVDAQTAKGIDTRPKQKTEYAAESLQIRFGPKGVLQTVTGDRHAWVATTTPTARTTVNAPRVDLDFKVDGDESTLAKALATGGAVVESVPVARPNVPMPDTRLMRSHTIAVYMRPGGEEMDHVDTEAPGTIEFRPNRPGQKRRVVDGERMTIQYAAENQLRSYQAVNVTTRTESEPVKGKPQPPAITTSKGMNAEFEPKTGTMTKLEQWGDFRYQEGDRRAVSERAEMHQQTDELLLLGSARVWDPTGSTAADRIEMIQKTGDVEATGKVTSTRVPEKSNKPTSAGMLSGDDPLQAKADRMTSTHNRDVIVYEGNALLWQGPNRIHADRVRIERASGRLQATGKVETQLLEEANKAKKRDRTFTVVRSPVLNYDDKQRLAHYTGGCTLNRGAMVVTSHEIRAFLKSGDDSSLDHAFADGNVKIVQSAPDRVRTGTSEHAEYYADNGKVVLTGGRPQFTDTVKGTTQGTQITYYANDDKLLVEGEQKSPVRSKILRRSG